MINIWLASDQDIVRKGLRVLLDHDATINVVKETKALEDVNREDQLIDILLIAINFNTLVEDDHLVKIKSLHPHFKIVLFSPSDEKFDLAKILNLNVDAYLWNNIELEELLFGIKQVYKGFNYYSHDIVDVMVEKLSINKQSIINQELLDSSQFSKREIEVLHLIAQGYTNLEVANKLFLSKRTVEGHRQSLLTKFKVKNTAALIRIASQQHLI